MSFFSSPIFYSLAIFILSLTNLAMIYAFHQLQKAVDVLSQVIISERGIVKMLIDTESLKMATPSNQTCQ